MAVFAYVAKTADGKKVESVIRAADKGAAQAELKKKNLTVSTLVEQKAGKKSSFFGPPRPRVKTKDIAVMTRQLSTMISAGIPLLESLEILHEQASDPGFKLSLDKIIERVRAGSDFISICWKMVWNFGTMPTTRPTVIDRIRTSEITG